MAEFLAQTFELGKIKPRQNCWEINSKSCQSCLSRFIWHKQLQIALNLVFIWKKVKLTFGPFLKLVKLRESEKLPKLLWSHWFSFPPPLVATCTFLFWRVANGRLLSVCLVGYLRFPFSYPSVSVSSFPVSSWGLPMWIESLVLEGFRSFRDRTVIRFDRGHTAIVGRLALHFFSVRTSLILSPSLTLPYSVKPRVANES